MDVQPEQCTLIGLRASFECQSLVYRTASGLLRCLSANITLVYVLLDEITGPYFLPYYAWKIKRTAQVDYDGDKRPSFDS